MDISAGFVAGRNTGDGGVCPALAVPRKVLRVDNADVEEMERDSLLRWPRRPLVCFVSVPADAAAAAAATAAAAFAARLPTGENESMDPPSPPQSRPPAGAPEKLPVRATVGRPPRCCKDPPADHEEAT